MGAEVGGGVDGLSVRADTTGRRAPQCKPPRQQGSQAAVAPRALADCARPQFLLDPPAPGLSSARCSWGGAVFPTLEGVPARVKRRVSTPDPFQQVPPSTCPARPAAVAATAVQASGPARLLLTAWGPIETALQLPWADSTMSRTLAAADRTGALRRHRAQPADCGDSSGMHARLQVRRLGWMYSRCFARAFSRAQLLGACPFWPSQCHSC